MQTVFKKLVLTAWVAMFFVVPALATPQDDIQDSVKQARMEGVSDQLLNRILAAGYRYEVQSRHMVQWLAMVKNAAGEGIPQGPLVDKLEEGLSKRIEMERIDDVLAQQFRHLKQAELMLRHRYEKKNMYYQAAVTRIADLMMAGLSKEEIDLIILADPGARLNTSLNGLTFYTVLKQAEVPAEQGRQIVVNGLQKGCFVEFPVELAFMIKAAHSKNRAVEDIVREINRVINAQQSVRQMQQHLGLDSVQHPSSISGGNGASNKNRYGAGQGGNGSGGGSGHGSGRSGRSGSGSGGGR